MITSAEQAELVATFGQAFAWKMYIDLNRTYLTRRIKGACKHIWTVQQKARAKQLERLKKSDQLFADCVMKLQDANESLGYSARTRDETAAALERIIKKENRT